MFESLVRNERKREFRFDTGTLPHLTSHRDNCWEVGWGSGPVPNNPKR